jgi:hypothetical protein
VKTICPGANVYFILPEQENDYTYQWQVDSTGTGFVDLVNSTVYTGVTTDTLLLTSPPTSCYGFKYRCVSSKNNAPVIFGAPNSIKFQVTWQGNTSDAWQDGTNWGCNYVPDAFTDVIIPATLVNNPVVSNDAVVHGIILSPGTVLTVNTGVKLDIKGK